MKALLAAAGRGDRLRPLTDTTPKPLIRVGGKPLIEWHLESLARSGVTDVVINTWWLEEQFEPALGDGSRWGLRIHWSREGRDHGQALETAGGIAKALPLLGDVFWYVASDIFTNGADLPADAARPFVERGEPARLWMVEAEHHPEGDFGIDAEGKLTYDEATRPFLSFGSIALFRASFFDGIAPGTRLALRPLLDRGIARRELAGERWRGAWTDVGTVERWRRLESSLHTSQGLSDIGPEA